MSEGFEQLPAGKHGIAPQLVSQHQRTRILLAAAAIFAECGYAGATTTAIADRAGVSKGTFYEQFANIWEALHAAYALASEALCLRIAAACEGEREPRERFATGLAAGLDALAASPELALLLCSETPAAATELRNAQEEFVARLAALLEGGSEASEPAQWRVGAALAVVAARLRRGEPTRLGELTVPLGGLLAGG